MIGVLDEEEDDADIDLPGFGAEGGVVGCSIGLEVRWISLIRLHYRGFHYLGHEMEAGLFLGKKRSLPCLSG